MPSASLGFPADILRVSGRIQYVSVRPPLTAACSVRGSNKLLQAQRPRPRGAQFQACDQRVPEGLRTSPAQRA